MPSHDLPAMSVAPDGGWGWVVTFSSFMISVLVDGICLSVGVFLNDLIIEFGGTNSETSWVMSVLNGSYLVVGPVVSSCANKFGCRATTIAGAVFCAIAIFCSGYSNSLAVLIVSFGIFGGIGLGFMYLPAIVMVGYYFDKRRALATGIAVCGSGIGNFVFAPIAELLLKEYGWRGSMMITSALMLNGIIFGSFYRPLKPPKNKDLPSIPYQATDNEVKEPIIRPDDKHKQLNLRMKFKRIHDIEQENYHARRHRSLDITGTGRTFLPGVLNVSNNKEQSNIARMAASHDILPTHLNSKTPVRPTVSPFYRKDVLYSGSLLRLSEKMESPNMDEFISSMVVIPSDEDDNKKSCMEKIGKAFKKYKDLKPTFFLYSFACFLLMLGFFIPYTYLPSVGLRLNFSRNQSALLLSIIGISNTVFRIIIGWVSDQKWSNCFIINYTSLLVSGIATAFVPVFTNYPLLVSYCVVYGICIAAFISLRSIIMVELLGVENLTLAFGLIIMAQGISSFFGSPIAGWLSDMTGNFDAAFYMGGAALAVSGIICVPLERVSKWERKREALKSKTIVEVKELQPMINNSLNMQ
ncbi:monocarboxylate transporter 12 [Octopus bimaculoides]|uniref:Major facilitator superfamily (MFS) profile domain-containing protein n=1 Tax=Octopus bimaculoides TaxID=37653 RepID=A0A0L8HA19_OCTBM|nr:monocarboxylate transporter 12 [Octopus bimaculoides]XP_014774510.1 monocarboxylate transporter 12 [Octopus bimaculoides]XP_014774511.1 monocarboxylate transporter 12 [Octopus bimaculoides]XP_052831080.1 monocarboxylate transporter 12 [Octopus bimaculoides]XP_052831081.1 monocarboxylate transporter 12 [Octopus bimaculoides]XP_052831082.1 monocarboxylate transporter 12 [Octopus bimaculoides]|eukprot:XP_014774509.1 PREDICTED: monocarboxylate transporter 12-like [Octopus bimaculoides]